MSVFILSTLGHFDFSDAHSKKETRAAHAIPQCPPDFGRCRFWTFASLSRLRDRLRWNLFCSFFFVAILDMKKDTKRIREIKLQKIRLDVAQKVSHAIKVCFLLVHRLRCVIFHIFGYFGSVGCWCASTARIEFRFRRKLHDSLCFHKCLAEAKLWFARPGLSSISALAVKRAHCREKNRR